MTDIEEPRRTLKLTVAYDGSRYCGWQRQSNGPSIQAALEKALGEITRETILVTGSGRTDSGVHALGQVVSFDTQSALSADVFRQALNATLPPDIVVREALEAAVGFHAINDSLTKRYRYIVQPGRINDPFSLQRAWFVKRILDADVMHSAARELIGTHDFASFQAVGSPRLSTVRTVTDAEVRFEACDPWGKIFIEIEATGFLYNMVRIIAGTLVDIGQGRGALGTISTIITGRERKLAGMTAPAHGLYLLHVNYDRPPLESQGDS